MEIKDVISGLGALAQEHRLAVFRALVQEGPEGLPAGVLAERLGVAPATLSFHLSQLSHAGLVLSRRQGGPSSTASMSIVFRRCWDS